MNFKMNSQEIKNLNNFLKETNMFKRYILCQLWINSLFNNIIIEPINKYSKSTDNNDLTNETIYNIFRDIKANLINENSNLESVLKLQQNQRDILNVMNKVFELNEDDKIELINNELNKLSDNIKTNQDYIEKINNLSEAKINDIRNGNSQS